MSTVTSFTSDKILDLLSELDGLGQGQTDINTHLGDLDGSLAENQALLDELINIRLPQLQLDLSANQTLVDDLNENVLPDLRIDLDTNSESLETLNTVTIPDLNSQLLANDAELTSLSGKFPITETDISNNAITTPKLITNAVNADKIIANSIYADEITSNAVNTDELNANSVNVDKITTNSVAADEITSNAVNTDELNTNSVNADEIVTNAVNADEIISNSVSTDELTTNAVYAENIVANQINTNHIVANAVTSDEIEANAINAKHTITGAFIRTSSGGARIALHDEGGRGFLRFYDSLGVLSGAINSDDSPRRITVNGPGAGKMYFENGDIEVYNAKFWVTGAGGADIAGGLTVSTGGLEVSGTTTLNALAGTGGATMLVVGNSGVVSRGLNISYGANDSGGTGYRVVRVPN